MNRLHFRHFAARVATTSPGGFSSFQLRVTLNSFFPNSTFSLCQQTLDPSLAPPPPTPHNPQPTTPSPSPGGLGRPYRLPPGAALLPPLAESAANLRGQPLAVCRRNQTPLARN